MAGFVPVASLPVASIPETIPDDPNLVYPSSPIYLEFEGFLPSITNTPGLVAESFSFYAAGSDDEPGLQIESMSFYAAGRDAEAGLQVERYGVYIAGQVPPPMHVEHFGVYLVGHVSIPLEVLAFSQYIAGHDAEVDLQIEQYGVYLVARSTPLVIPSLAGIVPEVPVIERWGWDSDIMVSEDGTEQRVNLRAEPRRRTQATYIFGTDAEIRQAKRELYATFKSEVAMPLYQYATGLLAPAAAAATYLTFDPTRTDLRDDGWILVIENGVYELKVVDNLDGTGCTITTPLVNSYSTRALILPVLVGYIDDKTTLTSMPANGAAKLSLAAQERVIALVPFVRPGTTASLLVPFGDTLPVLEQRPVGEDFEEIVERGTDKIDFGGRVHYRDPWTFSKIGGEREFLCNRHLDMESWDYWKVFLDYCKGAVNPFYMPTFRPDFEPTAVIAGLDSSFTNVGQSYSETYFDNPAFQQLAIITDAGIHYAEITAVTPSGGNEIIDFNPALPAEAGWEDNQVVCLLQRVRLAIDEVGLEHYGLHTLISLSMVTADV